VARDKAFCFLYAENLQLLQQLGAELVYFSPLTDKHLPEGCQGLYLCGGYPELHGMQLSANESLRMELRAAIANGLPTIAECGGFLYLHETLQDGEGACWPMVGALPGKAWSTDKLQRFGYITLEAQGIHLAGKDPCQIRGHEFHYWESDCCGDGFIARKAGRKRSWPCANSSRTLYAGFPHLFFYSNPDFIKGFLRKAAAYGTSHNFVTTD
jgi:cobyrinic acid a,c-diamide synthase